MWDDEADDDINHAAQTRMDVKVPAEIYGVDMFTDRTILYSPTAGTVVVFEPAQTHWARRAQKLLNDQPNLPAQAAELHRIITAMVSAM